LISATQREIASKYGKIFSPYGVSIAPSGRRSKSGLPNSRSRLPIARDSDGCAGEATFFAESEEIAALRYFHPALPLLHP
jgi:hypothetical protein